MKETDLPYTSFMKIDFKLKVNFWNKLSDQISWALHEWLTITGFFSRKVYLQPQLLLNPILPGRGGDRPPLHHPKTVQGIKLKLSDFKDTPLKHILQVKPVRYILSCYPGNKITEGTLQDLAPKKNQPSVKILS